MIEHSCNSVNSNMNQNDCQNMNINPCLSQRVTSPVMNLYIMECLPPDSMGIRDTYRNQDS